MILISSTFKIFKIKDNGKTLKHFKPKNKNHVVVHAILIFVHFPHTLFHEILLDVLFIKIIDLIYLHTKKTRFDPIIFTN